MPAIVKAYLAGAAAFLGGSAALADLTPRQDPKVLAEEIEAEKDHIGALELAERLTRNDGSLSIFDLRSQAEFHEFHSPSAQLTTVTSLSNLKLAADKTIVVYSEGGGHAAQAWVLLRLRGYRNVLFLREGIYEWLSRVDQPRLAVDATAKERTEFTRAAKLSRFFGGSPRADVPRAEVPLGYWNESDGSDPGAIPPAPGTKKIRRRGC